MIVATIFERQFNGITHLVNQAHWELIPLRTRVLHILFARNNLLSSQAICWRNDSSFDAFSFQLQCAICHYTYIYIMQISHSKQLIIDYMINARVSRYRHDQWHSQFGRTFHRYHSSRPYEWISVVSEGQFHMLTRCLHSIEVHVVPLHTITFLYFRTLIPIKGNQVIAQARIGSRVHYVQTKTDRLVRMNLQINILGIYLIIYTLYASQFLQEFA